MKNKGVKVKTVRDLNMLDTICMIQEGDMVDNLNIKGWDSVSLNSIRYFSLEKLVIKEQAFDDPDDPKELIINGKHRMDWKPKFKADIRDIQTDEGVAVALVLREIELEKKRVKEFIKIGEKCLGGLDSNAEIYIKRADELGVHVTIKDNDDIVLDTDESVVEDGS